MLERTWLVLAISGSVAGCFGSELDPVSSVFALQVGWQAPDGGAVDLVSPDVVPEVAPPDGAGIDVEPECRVDEDCTALTVGLGPCVRPGCDVAVGVCEVVARADGAPCSDHDLCTLGDVCLDGVCRGTRPAWCDDFNPCTDDWCEATTGCRHAFNEAPCNDDQPCTSGDVCQGGVCRGKPTPECFSGACCSQNGTPGCDDHPINACVCSQEPACCDLTRTWDKHCVELVETLGCGECPDAVCGDTLCGLEEDCLNCPDDCGLCPGCGDGLCATAAGENCFNCVPDCGTCAGEVCGDSVCGESEDCQSCPNDCVEACGHCGDGTCTDAESCLTCPSDCGTCPDCGDGLCLGGENCFNCEADCGACAGPVCGDGACDEGEGCEVCPHDCGECVEPVCGDGSCDPDGEDCEACPADCGPCPPGCPDGVCDPGESCNTCPADCGPCAPGCGDGVCDAGEDCVSCPSDCGSCGPVCGDGWCDPGEDCSTCTPDCGPCDTGDCCIEHDTPGCGDAAVESCVCSYDSYCCYTSWDSLCVDEVETYFCGSCSGTGGGSCCVESNLPGCGDPFIEACVCLVDYFCCDTAWDSLCVSAVETYGCGSCY